MNLEKEIRIAKVQIMWTITVATFAVGILIRMPDIGFLWDLFLAALLMAVWYFGVWDLRKTIETREDIEE
jgi:membrane protein implicated in regulation of membrane protease activity